MTANTHIIVAHNRPAGTLETADYRSEQAAEGRRRGGRDRPVSPHNFNAVDYFGFLEAWQIVTAMLADRSEVS